jgi:hypothetical protein
MRPGEKRTLADVMRADWAISIRRACAANLVDPKTYRYNFSRPGKPTDTPTSKRSTVASGLSV